MQLASGGKLFQNLVVIFYKGLIALECTLFDNKIFSSFLEEIRSLGFVVSETPHAKSTPYAVIGGRSNARWWLVPLANRHVTTSGLALFQPILPSAKVLKDAASTLSVFGLSRFWAKNCVHISCPPVFSDLFKNTDLYYAFFTGTDSPHRKAAVQIMDRLGQIKGFAKISCNSAVRPLLIHEAQTLTKVNSLGIETAIIPEVLYSGESNGTEVLVTDSRKTPSTKTIVSLKQAHINFLRELAKKTSLDDSGDGDWSAEELRRSYFAVAEKLSGDWQCRLEKAIEIVSGYEGSLGPRSLNHGDFTPWNTFFVSGRLYVFDWEYASHNYPVGYDLIHYILSLPKVKQQSVSETIMQVREVLRAAKIISGNRHADVLFLCYLCGHSLLYIDREVEVNGKVMTWGETRVSAVCIDTLIHVKLD